MLRDLGFDVAEATNGREGLARLEDGEPPDLVLVDWNMPEMNGIEFLTTVRSEPYSSTARILMITTETDLPQVVEALESGADEYLMKPFTRDSVLAKLQLLGIEV
jgi:two-component system, chemotaxis family, chemotaxis protein CheY